MSKRPPAGLNLERARSVLGEARLAFDAIKPKPVVKKRRSFFRKK